MARVFHVDGPPDEALEAAARALADGRCVVFPTDTVFGIAARPDLPAATEGLFEAKRRRQDLTLPILVAGTREARAVAAMDERAESLAGRFWPGALTLVLPRTDLSRGWELGAERETVGVRVPADELVLALLARTGPLAVTSANLSGQPTPATCRGVRRALGEAVAVYVCAGSPRATRPSTVVGMTGEEPVVLRAGAIRAEDISSALEHRAGPR